MSERAPAGKRVCANHPARPGHALCMACRKVVCDECATEWDGINYCVGCLAQRRRDAAHRPSLFGYLAVTAAAALLFAAGVRVMVWCGALLASLAP